MLGERKTLRITLWMLEKSGETAQAFDDADEDEEEEEMVEEGRAGLPPCLPWLMVTTG